MKANETYVLVEDSSDNEYLVLNSAIDSEGVYRLLLVDREGSILEEAATLEGTASFTIKGSGTLKNFLSFFDPEQDRKFKPED